MTEPEVSNHDQRFQLSQRGLNPVKSSLSLDSGEWHAKRKQVGGVLRRLVFPIESVK